MIPLRDDQPCFSTPFITYFLIALNILVFLFELSPAFQSRGALTALLFHSGVVPSDGRLFHPVPASASADLVPSHFLVSRTRLADARILVPEPVRERRGDVNRRNHSNYRWNRLLGARRRVCGRNPHDQSVSRTTA